MKRTEKPWGYELLWAHTDKYVGKLLHIDAGHALSKQYHQVKDETILVLKGQLTLEIGDGDTAETLIMNPDDTFHVTPGTIHRFVANQSVDLVEVSTPELGDVVRLEDRYGREGTSKA